MLLIIKLSHSVHACHVYILGLLMMIIDFQVLLELFIMLAGAVR